MTFVVNRTLYDAVADCLMQLPNISGFTESDVQGFSHNTADMTTAEQVAGRRQMAKFELLLDNSDVDSVLQALSQVIGNPFRYWLLPLLVHMKTGYA